MRAVRYEALGSLSQSSNVGQNYRRQRNSSSDGLSDDSTAFWEGLVPSAAAITAITNTISQAMDSKDWTSGVTGAAPPDGCAGLRRVYTDAIDLEIDLDIAARCVRIWAALMCTVSCRAKAHR